MKETTINGIEAILASIEADWLANDGGLTMAASDALSFGAAIISHIQDDDVNWVWDLDPFSADTGEEGEMIDLALAWARSMHPCPYGPDVSGSYCREALELGLCEQECCR